MVAMWGALVSFGVGLGGDAAMTNSIVSSRLIRHFTAKSYRALFDASNKISAALLTA